MYRVYLLLGGNLGDREKNMADAIEELRLHIGEVVLTSSLYETAAWGNKNQPDFLNKAVVIETKLNALIILNRTQIIEEKLGRKREEHWGARTMDIDLLFYDNEIIDTERLKIPHPLIYMRKFVLLPLVEIIPEFIHPILKTSVKDLYLMCEDKLEVKKLNTNVN